MIEDQLQHVAAWRNGAAAPVAIATFVWLASSGVHSVFDALQVQTGGTRPWWKQRLLAVATCVALSVGVAVLGLLATGVHWIETLAGVEVPRELETVWSLVLRAVAGLGIAVAMVEGLYWVGIPRHARGRVPLLPGAALAVVLVGALGWGYGAYVSTMGNSSAYVGGLAAIGVTLMTLWLFSVALLLGAQLNQVIADRRTSRGGHAADVASRLPGQGAKWPTFDVSSSRPTSPKRPTEPSTGPSRWRPGLGRPSR